MKVKQIPFPIELIEQVDKKRKKMGIGFPEYIRHLVLNDIQDSKEDYITSQEERNIAKSMKEFSEGRYTVLRNSKEIRKYFNKLFKEECPE